MAAIRALFALPFVAVLPVWALAFAKGAALLSIYPVGLLMALPMTWLVLRHWPKDGQTRWQDAPSGLSFNAALAESLKAPDLVQRLIANAPLVKANSSTFYAPGPEGYIDYPAM